MPLDPRLILMQRPLESFADMQDRRTQREIQQQEVELRRQEIMARRDAIIDAQRQRNQPKPYDPVEAGHEYDLRVKQAAGVAALLEQATDPDTYEQAKQGIAQIVGPDYVQHLPPTFDPAVNARLVAQGKALIAKAQTEKTTLQRIETLDDAGNPVQRFVTPTEGASYPIRPPAPSAAGRPVAIETVENGKRVRKFVMPTEGASYPVPESAGAAGPKPRAVTSGDANKIAELNNSMRDLDVLSETISGVAGATGPSAAVGAALPNVVTNVTGWGTQAKEKQAMIDRVKQVIGKALEGGVLRKEDEDKYKKILPTISDAPDVVTSKLDGLRAAIDRKRDEQLSALEDAGYDTSRFRARESSAPKTPAKKSAPKKVGRFTVEEAN